MIKECKVNDKVYRICPMEYLDGLEYTEEEIDEFVDESTLYDSYCIGVLCETNPAMSAEDAIRVMTEDAKWYVKYFWTPNQRVSYEKRFVPILRKVFGYDLDEAWSEVEIWSGFGSTPSMYRYGEIELNDELYEKYVKLHDEAYEELKKSV